MRTTDLASITRLGRVQASASLFPTRTFYIPERRTAENRSPTTHPYSRCQLRCSERTRLYEKPDGFFQKPHAYMIEGRRKDARRLHERRTNTAGFSQSMRRGGVSVALLVCLQLWCLLSSTSQKGASVEKECRCTASRCRLVIPHKHRSRLGDLPRSDNGAVAPAR